MVPLVATPEGRIRVMFLPGIMMPAAPRYATLLEALDPDVDPVVKDLEVYEGPTVPPPGYTFGSELDGIARAADDAGWERFHLYGHSAGGACALAFTAVRPERVLTLAVDEPALDFSREDTDEVRRVFLPLIELPPEEAIPAFLRAQLREGSEPPPPREGPPPPWMADRPAGVRAFVLASSEAEVPIERLRNFDRPVYFSYGSLSNERWERMANRLSELLPNLTVERYEGISHLRTSHVAEPGRVAASLRRLWAAAEAG
jgi:pimeloyl-ACP methyl ester carboxylesterase